MRSTTFFIFCRFLPVSDAFHYRFFGVVGSGEIAGEGLGVVSLCDFLRMADPTVYPGFREHLTQLGVTTRSAILKRLLPQLDTCPMCNLLYPTRKRFLRRDTRRDVRLCRKDQIIAPFRQDVKQLLERMFLANPP